MPLYKYNCLKCNTARDVFLPLKDCGEAISCSCGERMMKIPCIGGIQSDEPVWLDDSVRGALQNTDRIARGLEKPITTRTEWKRHLKEHNIIPTG